MPSTPTATDGALSNVVVVDGSNIATEGRSLPSLKQLNEAVLAFAAEHPEAEITVVVDATFGHRIDKSERAEFDEAVAHNELVAPPAGAIGRGDAFVLSIANKARARILSNDSFQEFHGTHPWLFDEGRLIGGKPVPNIGWVFVDRVPVKGVVSRRARSANGSSSSGRAARQASKAASQPMPTPKSPPPGLARRNGETSDDSSPAVEASAAVDERGARDGTADRAPAAASGPSGRRGRRSRGKGGGGDDAGGGKADDQPSRAERVGEPVNELMPFLDFVQHHPVGTAVTGVVSSYSSHGAYVDVGDINGYVPLRLMGDPPPRKARDVLPHGATVALVVASYQPARRSVDLALPGTSGAAEASRAEVAGAEATAATVSDAVAAELAATADSDGAEVAKAPAKKVAAKKAPAKKAAAAEDTAAEKPAKKAPAKKADKADKE